jgi:hypothetical protein
VRDQRDGAALLAQGAKQRKDGFAGV